MLEKLKELFTYSDIALSFRDIKNKLPHKFSENEIKEALKKLELDGHLYYNEKNKLYMTFPSNFFVASAKRINTKKNAMTIIVNGKSKDIPYREGIEVNDKIIVVNKKNKYRLVKKLDYKVKSHTEIEHLINNLFNPLNNGLTIKNIKEQLDADITTSKLENVLESLQEENICYYDEFREKYYKIDKDTIILEIKTGKCGLYVNYNGKQHNLNNHEIASADIALFEQIGSNLKFVRVIKRKSKTFKLDIMKEIINILDSSEQGLSYREILIMLKNDVNKNYLKNILNELEESQKIFFNFYENKYFSINNNIKLCKVIANKNGILYVNNEDGIRVPINNERKNVYPGDDVIAEINEKSADVLKIINRANPVVLEVNEGKLRVVGNDTIKVFFDKETRENYDFPSGTRILGMLDCDTTAGKYHVTYLKTLGHKYDLTAEFKAIAINNGFRIDYTEEELKQLESIPTELDNESRYGKADLRNEVLFTIDGDDTKDMDDAIGIKILPNGNYELTVAIANVINYIPFGSPLFKRAEHNTTSLYMIDKVSHMIHPKVSNGICSLNPNVDRLAKVFKLEITKHGNVINFSIIDAAVISSRIKMTYSKVNEILLNDNVDEEYEPFKEDLLLLNELARILIKKKSENGSLNFSNKEIYFKTNENGELECSVTNRGPAEKLIEIFMIITNEEVANYLLNLGIIGIYRNHEVPMTEKILDALSKVKAMGMPLEKLKYSDNPHLIQKVLTSLEKREEFFIVSLLLIKSMTKAYYSKENRGHFALALNAYSQSTSPIRRFLDLLIQYILDNINNLLRDEFDLEHFSGYVIDMCIRASHMERQAEKCEYEANKLYMIDYCALHPDNVYEAYVVDINNEGIVVKTKEMIEGIIRFESLDDGLYAYQEKSKMLVHRITKETVHIGTKLNVVLNDYNKERRSLYFKGNTIAKDINLTRKKN